MNKIEYNNPDRIDPLVLDRYIFVVCESGKLTYRVIDSFYSFEDAEATRKTLEVNNSHYDYTIHKSRLYK